METNDRVKAMAERIAVRLDGRTVTSHEHYRQMLKKELVHELTTHDQARHASLVAAVEGLEITSKPELKFVNPHIKTWEDGYNFALEEVLTIINSIFKE